MILVLLLAESRFYEKSQKNDDLPKASVERSGANRERPAQARSSARIQPETSSQGQAIQESLKSKLRELLAIAEVNQLPPDPGTGAFLFIGLRKEPSLLFRSESLALFRSIQATLSGSALAHGGPSRKATEKLLIDVCTVNFLEGERAALDLLEARLKEPLGAWTVVEAISAFVPSPDLRLGASRLFPSLPDDLVAERPLEQARAALSGPWQ